MGMLKDLLKKLEDGEVVFIYRTRSGSLRKARGTLNEKRIPKEDWPKSKLLRQPKPKTDEFSVRQRMYQPFYDLDINEWRRFKVLNLMRIVSSRPIANVLQKIKTGFKSIFGNSAKEDDEI